MSMNLRALWKGWIGEKTTSLGMWMFLDQNIYRRVHSVIVPTTNGTTQIDHVLVSPFGIFVIETKNMSGWIYGREKDSHWTQVFPKQKHRFQNPLRQNYRHTKSLAGFLRLDHSLFHSIAFFIGDCRFKTPMPENVMSKGLASYIKRFTLPRLDPAHVLQIVAALEQLKTNPVFEPRDHVAALRKRYSSVTTCPHCGRPLLEKTARRGPSTGQSFLACTGYPICTFTRSVA
jgi:restriction system protein